MEHLSNCRALVRMMPAVYAVVGPVHTEISAKDVRLAPEHASLWTIAPKGKYAANVNGMYISRCQWYLPLQPGDLIVFEHVAHGGGASNPLRIVLQLAVLAAAFYTGGAVGAAYGPIAGAFASAAVSIVGSLLINRLAPMPSQSFGQNVAAPSPTYSVALQGNNARLGQAIPVRYGLELIFPDFAAIPYSEFDADNNQYFCATYCIGRGQYQIQGVYLDDTPIENFIGIEVLRIGEGQSLTSTPFPGVETYPQAHYLVDSRIMTSIEVGGQDLVTTDWVGPFIVNYPGTEIDTLYWDMVAPRGMGIVQNDGSVTDYGFNFEVSVRKVDDQGRATTNWSSLGMSHITGHTSTPVRRSYSTTAALPYGVGRYQIRMRRELAKDENNRYLNDLQWVGLRARLNVVSGVLRTDVTGLAVRVRANEQLTGLSQRKVSVLVQRLINGLVEGGNGIQFSDAVVASRSPADAFADILHNSNYGRGLSTDRIDLETLYELKQLYATRGDCFDYSFDNFLTIDDSLRIAARAGRAVPLLRRGAVYTMVRDQQQAGPIALFMPRNMEQDSFRIEYVLPTEETIDAVRITYRDNQVWDDRHIIGQIQEGQIYLYEENERPAELDTPSNLVDMRLLGVCGRNHAYRETAYIVADSLYRRVRPSWTTELEGLMPTFGSLVSLAHDVSSWAQSGDVLSYTSLGIGGVVDVADPLTWTEGQQHYVRFQSIYGEVSEAIAVTKGATNSKMVLGAAYSGTVYTADGGKERTRYLFGALSEVQRYARIIGINPRSDMLVDLQTVIEDNRVHEADALWSGVDSTPTTGGTTPTPGTDPGIDPNDPNASWLVNLNENVISEQAAGLTFPSIAPSGEVTVNNDGRLLWSTGNSGNGALSEQWILPQPVTTEVTSQYEVRFECNAVAPYDAWLYGSALNTWLNLGTSRTVGVEMVEADTNGEGFFVQFWIKARIRNAATQVELASQWQRIKLEWVFV